MTLTLNEGVGNVLKLIEKYFKLKGEVTSIETTVKRMGFKSVEELTVLLAITTQANMTIAELVNNTSIVRNTLKTLVLRLIEKGYITAAEDKTDTTKNLLRRQIYTPTAKGIDLVAKLKSQLQ